MVAASVCLHSVAACAPPATSPEGEAEDEPDPCRAASLGFLHSLHPPDSNVGCCDDAAPSGALLPISLLLQQPLPSLPPSQLLGKRYQLPCVAGSTTQVVPTCDTGILPPKVYPVPAHVTIHGRATQLPLRGNDLARLIDVCAPSSTAAATSYSLRQPTAYPADIAATGLGSLATALATTGMCETVAAQPQRDFPSPATPPKVVTVVRKSSFRDIIGIGQRPRSKERLRTTSPSSDSTQLLLAKPSSPSSTSSLFSEKYGVCDKVAIGKGSTSVVRVVHKSVPGTGTEKVYAVKEFRKRRKAESEREYIKKLTSEFCISSSLCHVNIVQTIDLIQDDNHHWCEIMEYCPGGDLYSAIMTGKMTSDEMDCCFKQLVNGVHYLHCNGVAHHDLKPENLLLNERGQLKIADFGVSEVFKMCWESEPHLSKGVIGSAPYVAPEEFNCIEYDARAADVWACAIVYYAMVYKAIPWRHAVLKDPNYSHYVENRDKQSCQALNAFGEGCRELIYAMLEPDPIQRLTIEQIRRNAWLEGVQGCCDDPQHKHIHHTSAHHSHKTLRPTPSGTMDTGAKFGCGHSSPSRSIRDGFSKFESAVKELLHLH